ncbi:DUF1707 domain-containing protein [Corynebacterium breve]|uniref:DUF1707 domain-containing protein n=1 Tax=Corynebacterium breve TaxID=3049799 RepID=A0ABY8VF02_9CORY|nr:DUF1707 domain-containing protein [Corynebacterium breve]WIM68069.1 DUF1707 domain-containing protein [Corynebacterium breve]
MNSPLPPEHTPNTPRRRATSQEREIASNALSEAFADGQITLAEFEERTSVVWKCTFGDELDDLTKDLVLSPTQPPILRPPNQASHFVSTDKGGSKLSLAIMGAVTHEGDWQIGAQHVSFAMMGGTDLNLQHARLSSTSTTISAFALMGGVRLVVPEDVRVKAEGFGLMGAFEVKDHPSVTVAQRDLPADAPSITIRGAALMGAVEVLRVSREAIVPAD